MTREEIRLECLRLAHLSDEPAHMVVERAEAYAAFLESKPDPVEARRKNGVEAINQVHRQ